MSEGGIVASFVVPVHPHTVLAPTKTQGGVKLRDAYDDAAATIKDLNADLIIIYSTTWPSIIGTKFKPTRIPSGSLSTMTSTTSAPSPTRSTSMLTFCPRVNDASEKGACRADVSTTRASRLT